MQHQPILKRVNEAHEWAHMSYQLPSAPYHCCLYKNGDKMKVATPKKLTGAHLCLDIAKSGYLFHGCSGGKGNDSTKPLPEPLLT